MTAAAATELVIGDVIAGKYRIEQVLGRGGMGAVYLATNEDLGRKVAIKVLLAHFADDEQLLKRFKQEARTAAAIGHPGIVDVLDLGTAADGSPFIVMEALDGEAFSARIARERRMDVHDAVEIVAQVLDALAAAHAKDVLHRDLKPDNVFLVARPVRGVKILDFGISKLGGAAGDDVAITHTGAVMGTPLYMSPEQARGAKQLTTASDVYSVGAMLYQALAGRTPFVGSSYNELIANVLTAPYPPLVELRGDAPAALSQALDVMLARDPDTRVASALDARARILAAIEGVPRAVRAPIDAIADTAAPIAATASIALHAATAATAAPSAPPPRAAKPTRAGVWIGVGLVVAAAVGLGAIALTRGGGAHTAAPADAPQVAPALAPADATAPLDAAITVVPVDAAAPLDAALHPLSHPPAPRDAGAAHPAPVDAAPSGPLDIDHASPFGADAGR